jgi:hypothetical protein
MVSGLAVSFRHASEAASTFASGAGRQEDRRDVFGHIEPDRGRRREPARYRRPTVATSFSSKWPSPSSGLFLGPGVIGSRLLRLIDGANDGEEGETAD